MIRLLFCPRFAHRRMTDRPAPVGGNMATAVPPRCDADHNFCDDSERFRKATAGGLLAFRSHPNERGTERGESVLCLCGCAVAAVVRARADVAAASAAAPATKCATARRGGFIMFVPGNAEQRAGFIRP